LCPYLEHKKTKRSNTKTKDMKSNFGNHWFQWVFKFDLLLSSFIMHPFHCIPLVPYFTKLRTKIP
jgi:hypothetical protein